MILEQFKILCEMCKNPACIKKTFKMYGNDFWP